METYLEFTENNKGDPVIKNKLTTVQGITVQHYEIYPSYNLQQLLNTLCDPIDKYVYGDIDDRSEWLSLWNCIKQNGLEQAKNVDKMVTALEPLGARKTKLNNI